MNKLLIGAFSLLFSMPVYAQSGNATASAGTLIEKSISYPVAGPGGWSEITHKFSRGDRILLHYEAEKQLYGVRVTLGEHQELAKQLSTKNGDLQFVVPKTGEVVIRFTNDRNGKNEVKYELRKL